MTTIDTSDSELEAFQASFYPPSWLASHSELISRNIHLVYAFKPGYVYSTHPNRYVVKITDAASDEVTIYEELLQSGSGSPKHILPCTIIRRDTVRPFIIMPCLTDLSGAKIRQWDLRTIVHNFRQMIEAVELLHSRNIAHMDIAVDNFVIAKDYHIPHHDCVELGHIYIIDFGASHQFELSPGHQPAVELPSTQAPKPRDIKRLDPFSWDMYCLGLTFQTILEGSHSMCHTYDTVADCVIDSRYMIAASNGNLGYSVATLRGLWATSEDVLPYAIVAPVRAERTRCSLSWNGSLMSSECAGAWLTLFERP